MDNKINYYRQPLSLKLKTRFSLGEFVRAKRRFSFGICLFLVTSVKRMPIIEKVASREQVDTQATWQAARIARACEAVIVFDARHTRVIRFSMLMVTFALPARAKRSVFLKSVTPA
jgi:hypothetical protein